MAVRALRNALLSIVPNWLSNRPGLNNGFKILYTAALMGDCMIEAGLEGVRASWPGKGTPTALPYIGQGRGIIQGEAETNDHYAGRLRGWLATWENAASAEILAQQIQNWLGNNPVVRVVDRAGNWVIANTDGTTTFLQSAWDWDSQSGWDTASPATVAGWWSDIWIIVYPCEWPKTPVHLPLVPLDPKTGIGHQVVPSQVSTILGLVSTWKGAHTFVRAIIWTYTSTSFNPQAVGVMPDGTYGNWYKMVNGVAVQARDTDSRYWEPLRGG